MHSDTLDNLLAFTSHFTWTCFASPPAFPVLHFHHQPRERKTYVIYGQVNISLYSARPFTALSPPAVAAHSRLFTSHTASPSVLLAARYQGNNFSYSTSCHPLTRWLLLPSVDFTKFIPNWPFDWCSNFIYSLSLSLSLRYKLLANEIRHTHSIK